MEVAFGGEADALGLLRGSSGRAFAPNRLTQVQKKLGSAWTTGPLWRQVRVSSFDLLILYLRNPYLVVWQKAVFVDLLRFFDPRRMLEAHFRACFESAAKDRLPQQSRDELLEAEGTLCVAGRVSACDSAFKQGDLLVSRPTATIKGMDVDAMAAPLHLRDETPEAGAYRRAWNGVRRLFNLIQFLSMPWWSSTTAVTEGTYPDFACPVAPKAVSSAERQQTFEEADPCVQSLLGDLATLGAPQPDASGFELTDPSGRVVGEAESAWTDSKVVPLRENQRNCAAPFEAAGWRVFDEGVEAGGIRGALAAAKG